MSSKQSRSGLSINDHKAVLAEASSLKKSYTVTRRLSPGNELLARAVWYKGSRDRGLRGNLAA